jgi:hypothetical protein
LIQIRALRSTKKSRAKSPKNGDVSNCIDDVEFSFGKLNRCYRSSMSSRNPERVRMYAGILSARTQDQKFGETYF